MERFPDDFDFYDIVEMKRWLLELVPGTEEFRAQLEDRLDSAYNDLSWDRKRDENALLPAASLAMRDVIAAMDRSPLTAALFPLYLRRCCEATWEVSWDHTPIIEFVNEVTIARAQAECDLALEPPAELQRDIAYQLLGAIKEELRVETAISLAEHDTHASVAASARKAFLQIRQASSRLPRTAPLRRHLRETAKARQLYFDAVALAARAVDDFLRRNRGILVRRERRRGGIRRVTDNLEEAIGKLAAVEQVTEGVERSELRAHRLALSALREHALAIIEPGPATTNRVGPIAGSDGSQSGGSVVRHGTGSGARDDAVRKGWLRIDEGQIICIYPFGFYGDRENQVAELIRTSDRRWNFGGVVTAQKPTKSLMSNDIWNHELSISLEELQERTYGGSRVKLPDVIVRTPRAKEPLTLEAELIFSNLGNHHLRLVLGVEDDAPLFPDELARLTWLFAPEYGELPELDEAPAERRNRVTVAAEFEETGLEPPSFANIADFVKQLFAAVGDEVNQAFGTGASPLRITSRPGMHNVVVRVTRASCVTAGGAAPLEHPSEMLSLFGSQLINHPMPAGIGSIAQWANYDRVEREPIECSLLHRDLIHMYENVTLLACFGSPSFFVDCAQEALEFALSLEGMIQAWIERLAWYAKHEMSALFASIEAETSVLIDRKGGRRERSGAEKRLSAAVNELEARQVELRRLRAWSEVTMHFIESPSLVTSAATWQMLHNFIQAARIPQLHASYSKLATDIFSDRVEALVASGAREEERQRRDDTMSLIQFATTFVALLGVSGLLSLTQAGLRVHDRNVVYSMIAGTVIFALVVGLYQIVAHRRMRQRRTLIRSAGP